MRKQIGSLSVRIFFDTEFSGLTSDPRLLSIGFVAEDGAELYIEFTDGWSEEKCSPWVREHVLPMLGNGEGLSRHHAARRIYSWLTSFETKPCVMGETDWDTTLLANLMDENSVAREGYNLENLNNISTSQMRLFEAAKQANFRTIEATPHHALIDARAFRVAWHEILGTKIDSTN